MSLENGYIPPESVSKNAIRGLEYRKKAKNKGGLTSKEASKYGVGSGVQRAINLKNKDSISIETIKKMVNFFNRHKKNKEIDIQYKTIPWEDKGYVSWLLWGGDAGKIWSNKILNKYNKDINERIYNNSMSILNNIQLIIDSEDIDSKNNNDLKLWFGNSKVVDAQQNPLIVYHGTKLRPTKNSTEIDLISSVDGAIYFTDSLKLAKQYGRFWFEAYLKIENPIILDANFEEMNTYRVTVEKHIKNRGNHDGIIVYNIDDSITYSIHSLYSTLYLVFDNNQIKIMYHK